MRENRLTKKQNKNTTNKEEGKTRENEEKPNKNEIPTQCGNNNGKKWCT